MLDGIRMTKGSNNSMLEDFDLNRIQDIEGARQAILQLLNMVEELAGENRKLREDNQQLRDEINRLKGEQASRRSRRTKDNPAQPGRITRLSVSVASRRNGRKPAKWPRSKLTGKK